MTQTKGTQTTEARGSAEAPEHDQSGRGQKLTKPSPAGLDDQRDTERRAAERRFEGLAQEVKWEGTPEHDKALKNRRRTLLIGAVLLVLTALVGIGAYVADGRNPDSTLTVVLVITALALAYAGLIVLLSAAVAFYTARKKFYEREEFIRIAAERREALHDAIENPGIQSLLALNRADTEQYHKITRTQAEKSFRSAQIAMFVGFFTVIFGAISILLIPVPEESKIVVAVLSGLGGAIAAFINKTFQQSHSLSLSQLNSFFRQPLVQSYLLTAERVALQLEKPQQAKVLARIVEQAIAAANHADIPGSSSPGRNGISVFHRPEKGTKRPANPQDSDDLSTSLPA